MATQEERSKGIFNLLLMATKLLKEDTNIDKNFETAQNLVRQAFFKYLDLADCPFRETCNEVFREEYEPEAPYNWREDVD